MIDFPASPTDGQIFSATNGVVYKWSATYSSWLAQNPAPAIGGTGDFYATGTGIALPNSTFTLILPTVLTGNVGLWYSVSTGRYVPPAGRYVIFASLVGGGSAAVLINFILRKNGTQITTSSETPAAAGYSNTCKVQAIVDANGSDFFDLQVAANTTTSTASSVFFGAFPLTGLQGPTGPAGVTQTVFFETGAVATGTTVVPFDDTIPQQTEGDQYMTLSITPQSATSKLIIEVTAVGCSSVGNNMFACLFQDSTANSLAVAMASIPNANNIMTISFRHVMTSGTTSATTFKVRMGGNGAGTTTFNGSNAGTRLMGGAMASSIVIREVP